MHMWKRYCVFGTFPYGVSGQVWYLIVSIPDLCLLLFFGLFSFTRLINSLIQEHECSIFLSYDIKYSLASKAQDRVVAMNDSTILY